MDLREEQSGIDTKELEKLFNHQLEGRTFTMKTKYGGEIRGVIKSVIVFAGRQLSFPKGYEKIKTPSGKEIPNFKDAYWDGFKFTFQVLTENGNRYNLEDLVIK